MTNIVERMQQRIDWDFDPITAQVLTDAIAFFSEEQQKSERIGKAKLAILADRIKIGEYAGQLQRTATAFLDGHPVDTSSIVGTA